MPGTKLKNATKYPIILFGKTIQPGKVSDPIEDRLIKHFSVRQLIRKRQLVAVSAVPAPAVPKEVTPTPALEVTKEETPAPEPEAPVVEEKVEETAEAVVEVVEEEVKAEEPKTDKRTSKKKKRKKS